MRLKIGIKGRAKWLIFRQPARLRVARITGQMLSLRENGQLRVDFIGILHLAFAH